MAKFNSFSSERALRVLVDMDMVLCDFEGHLLSEFLNRHPNEPSIPLEKRRGFYVKSQYCKLREDLGQKITDIYNEENFFLRLPEIPGACDALRELTEMEGVEAFICTSPLVSYEFCLKEKCQWVEQHLGKDWVENLILIKDKTLINADLLIDDRPQIKGVVKRPTWEHVVFTACHNIKSDIGIKRRLDNWTDGTWRELIAEFKMKI